MKNKEWKNLYNEFKKWKTTRPNYNTNDSYYNLDEIASFNADYNLAVGERSNGKTYQLLLFALWLYVKHDIQSAYIRRWAEDIRGARGSNIFSNLVTNGEVAFITNNQYTDIYYYSGRWFLCKYTGKDGTKRILDTKPCCFAFALSNMEHDKSTAYPNVRLCIFDEFMTRGRYLSDEFILFMNVLSTIIRRRDDVKIFMLANTVNQYAPYFEEMGLKDMRTQKQGTILKYEYGKSGLSCAVEYCAEVDESKKDSNKYFAFDNPKLEMITGGSWEMDIYPHCPCSFDPKDILFVYFIVFCDDVLQCEIVSKNNLLFTYIHRKTTAFHDEDADIIFEQKYDPRINHFRNILKPINKKISKLKSFFDCDMVYYQNNQVGEIVRNYILWCKSENLK